MAPFLSKAQQRWAYTKAGTKALGGKKRVTEWQSATKGRLPERKKKMKLTVNNKLKGSYGAMNPNTNKIEINVKGHKGDKRELASTIKHEMLHVQHPKMTEKQVYKKSAKTKISPMEQSKLLAKLRGKKSNYKVGALKRKFKMMPGEEVRTGDIYK